jgi:2-methylaconitate cis-trans-isomerase PrpF
MIKEDIATKVEKSLAELCGEGSSQVDGVPYRSLPIALTQTNDIDEDSTSRRASSYE